MPNIKSAEKRVDVIRKRTIRNVRIKSALRTTIRRFNEALGSANQEGTEEKLRAVIKAIDKAVTKGILHKNAAARKKSRLTKKFNGRAG